MNFELIQLKDVSKVVKLINEAYADDKSWSLSNSFYN